MEQVGEVEVIISGEEERNTPHCPHGKRAQDYVLNNVFVNACCNRKGLLPHK